MSLLQAGLLSRSRERGHVLGSRGSGLARRCWRSHLAT